MNTNYETTISKEEWYTPTRIIDALGIFDLDPCSPNKPFNKIANNIFTKKDNGLLKEWYGSVYCNPPYGKQTKLWLNKCAKHNNCIALVFARTDTKMFFSEVWNKASAIFFIKGRLKFLNENNVSIGSAGAPSVLIAYGKQYKRLENLDRTIQGKYIKL
jgi:hypothetical protein|tara:strand:+ start:132 stop:608 length:477 start_codon:yes stop_codon:yes gene_type:complete